MKLFLFCCITTLISSNTLARKIYGTAGCGLGNLVFGKENQLIASTTNSTSGNQWMGITSGTSNCWERSSSTAQKFLPEFIEFNRINLASDIARGTGETLISLTQILGCEKTSLVGTTLQKNYERIFNSENIDALNISDSILGVVRGDEILASDCKRVI